MDVQEMEKMLRETLADQRLSRSERRALSEVIADEGLAPGQAAHFRSIAFDLARGELPNDKRTRQVLDWLEDVVKLLIATPKREARAEAHFSPGDAPLHKILGLLDSARERADICVFTITDDRIASALLSAHKRGLPIRIVTDDDKSFDRGSDIQRLREAGIPTRVDRSPHHMHHKFALFDQQLLVTGSYNWTRSAARHNQENLIVSDDTRLARAFQRAFDKLWETLAP